MGCICNEKVMKAVVFTLGCKVNSCESASISKGLSELGYDVSDELGYADLYVLNTCAVTAEAEKKSRQLVARVRKFNKNAKIIVCGCASQNSPNDFICKEGVTLVTGTRNKSKISSIIDKTGVIIDDNDNYEIEALPPKRLKTRAFIKVQDGCNNFCAYCIIPYLRGRSRSRCDSEIVKEIEYLNPIEAVLTGINLSAYDFNGIKLNGLLQRLSGVKTRIRLGSLEEVVVNNEFLLATKSLYDFAPHFHLSLQSGSDSVLKKMNRHYTTNEFLNSVNLIRSFYPRASITTDIIVGFPTETDKDFADTLNFCKKAKFSDIHCFPYSSREGTVSSKLKDLPSNVKKERLNALITLKNELKRDFLLENVNKESYVILEEVENDYVVGYTENYIKTYVKGNEINKKVKVRLGAPYGDGLTAEIIKE